MEKKILDYFQGQSGSMAHSAKSSKIFDNRGDIGTNRENILKGFLQHHLPKRCHIISGGFVFDLENNVSKQIDLIITNDLVLQFTDNDLNKSFNSIEGCNTVISVKSKLDSKELLESIDNLASIPILKDVQYNPLLSNVEKFLKQVPLKVIFAYDGNSVESIKSILDKCENKIIEKMPDIIIVNDKYYLWKVGPDGNVSTSSSGEIRYEYGEYVIEHSYPYVGSMALFHFIIMIQKNSNLSSHIYLSYSKYMDKIEIYAKRELF